MSRVMKILILVSLICFPLFLSCGGRKAEHVEMARPPAAVVNSTPQNTRSSASLLAEEKATNLAKKVHKRYLGPLEKYDVITSEVDNGWRVTIQLKNLSPTITGGVTE